MGTRPPEELRELYGGGLDFDEPCLFANFVETVDGVVAIPDLPRSNALIAAESEADRFVMGLLRASADAILVGSGTMLASPTGTWRPERVYPPAAEAFAELRAGGDDPSRRPSCSSLRAVRSIQQHPALESRARSDDRRAARGLRDACRPRRGRRSERRRTRRSAAGSHVLHERGHSVILSEGGPTLFASLLASRLVDELFLTISPLLAGRAVASRLGLVEGVELVPQTRVAGRLRSVRTHGSHLFLRYALSER